jgi:hypothetical protein
MRLADLSGLHPARTPGPPRLHPARANRPSPWLQQSYSSSVLYTIVQHSIKRNEILPFWQGSRTYGYLSLAVYILFKNYIERICTSTEYGTTEIVENGAEHVRNVYGTTLFCGFGGTPARYRKVREAEAGQASYKKKL